MQRTLKLILFLFRVNLSPEKSPNGNAFSCENDFTERWFKAGISKSRLLSESFIYFLERVHSNNWVLFWYDVKLEPD